jgi:hypothetical protein
VILDAPFNVSEFNNISNLTETDDCGSAILLSGQSCTATIAFHPQQSCPWLPFGGQGFDGAPPASCPLPQQGSLRVTSPQGPPDNNQFAVPVTSTGVSSVVPSVGELDFSSWALGESSLPQQLSFINQNTSPVQILHAAATPCSASALTVLPTPLQDFPGANVVGGLQVVATPPQGLSSIAISSNNGTPSVSYSCDLDPGGSPNFQLSSDTCTGTLLGPGNSCTVEVTFVPQPGSVFPVNGFDYFLELNTVQCTSEVTSNCEIDGGRFPVELTVPVPSQLRMSPGAGMDFGKLPVGQTSTPLQVTLFNDPNDPKAGDIIFSGIVVSGDYKETDDCPFTLPVGGSCTLTVTFKPKIVGFDPGKITINFSGPPLPPIVHLRGTGQ